MAERPPASVQPSGCAAGDASPARSPRCPRCAAIGTADAPSYPRPPPARRPCREHLHPPILFPVRSCGCGMLTPAPLRRDRKAEGEGGALARYAVHQDVAPEQPREPEREGEPQPRASIEPGRGTIHLPEFVEDHVQVLGPDPDPGVADPPLHPALRA